MIALHRPSAKDRNLRNIFQTVDYGIQHQIGRLVKNQPHTSDRRIMIDRVIFGSIERFIGILIEHFAGKFPVWLAPVQVKVIPVSEKSMEYAQGVYDQLKAAGIRTELDRKDEKVGYKIRQAQLEKVPFMLVLGEKEAAEGKITVRSRDKGDLGVADLSTFIADVKKMTETREK